MTIWVGFLYNICMILTNAELKNLKDKKYRKEHNLFLVEGEKFCADVLSAGVEIVWTITTDGTKTEFPNLVVVNEQKLSSIATTKTNQNIVCICKRRNVEISSVGNSLILDGLQDPGNVGTLIRSAMAFGFEDIYLVNCADVYSEKVIRSSAGLCLSARLHIVGFDEVKNNKPKIAKVFAVADMNGQNISKICLPKERIAVIIGNEGQGVSDGFKSLADVVLSIPMSGKVESLNAGVAGSIIMQKIFCGG